MKLQSLQKLLFTILFLLVLVNSKASDFTIIYDRMYTDFLLNPEASGVEKVLNNISENGSFASLNYANSKGVRNHPKWLNILASAYKNPSNSYYNNSAVKAKYLKGLEFWIDTNHHADNWWVRYIAYPKAVRIGVILMRDEIKTDTKLYNKTIKYLRWSYEKNNKRHMTGANGVDIIMGAIAASIIDEDHKEMLDFKNKMDQLISIQNNGTGIENDFMFGQHSGIGRQMYIGNYGKEYLNSVLSYLKYCNGTIYNTNKVSLIESHFIEALQWIFYSKNYDPNQAGRMIGSNRINSFIGLGKKIVALNTPRNNELKTVLNRIRGENSLSGNRHFWRFDYMIHRRPHYFTSSRMTSIRTVGNEAGNGQGEKNFYAGSGVNYILYNGKEYSGKFFSNFNERQFPGITAEQDNAKLPIPKWGRNASSENSFAGGASDGTYGVSAMFLQRRGVSAKKSWFYFDDEFVCLGANINQLEGTAPVYSTINQSNKLDTPEYSIHGNIDTITGTKTLTNPDWVLHGGIGYFNIDATSTIVMSNKENIFSVNIDHGINPKNKTYAYIVRPDVTSSSVANIYHKSIPVKIEANNSNVQAVRHLNLKITEAVFYKADTLKLSTGTSITVDKPCVLLFNENTNEITIANPYCESDNPESIKVSISINNTVSNLTFNMPDGYRAGSSVSLYLK